MSVKGAVSKASNKSKRDGKWANRVEIKEKIVGKPPESLKDSLTKLVKSGSIEKKRGAEYWRPTNISGAAGKGSKGTRGGRTPARGDGRRTTGKKPTRRRSTGDSTRRTIAVGVASSVRRSATSSITRGLF